MRYQFVDCRWDLGESGRGRELYLAGHVPGASFLDVDRDLSDLTRRDAGRHPLPSPESFADSAGKAGIGPETFVVAYDQGMTGGAARLWWLLRHFGHDDVAVLRGGIADWAGPLRAGAEDTESRRFVPQPRPDTTGADELLRRLEDPGLVLVDARAPDRYRGDVEPIDAVAGRIPGAVNLPFSMASPVPAHILDADDIVVYCGSGVTACVDLLALAEAGRPDARLYPGSWSDWSARGLPAERG